VTAAALWLEYCGPQIHEVFERGLAELDASKQRIVRGWREEFHGEERLSLGRLAFWRAKLEE
jgi:hypothetical protein